jgi:hypothetical protein
MIGYPRTSLWVNAVLPNNLKCRPKFIAMPKDYFKVFVLPLQLKCVLNWCVLTSTLPDFTPQSAFSFMPLMSVLHLAGYKLGRHGPENCDSTNPATSQSLIIDVSIPLSGHSRESTICDTTEMADSLFPLLCNAVTYLHYCGRKDRSFTLYQSQFRDIRLCGTA